MTPQGPYREAASPTPEAGVIAHLLSRIRSTREQYASRDLSDTGHARVARPAMSVDPPEEARIAVATGLVLLVFMAAVVVLTFDWFLP